MKIALIDSGINKTKMKDGINVKDVNLFCYRDCLDHIKHGTVCAQIISDYVSEAELYNIKVCDQSPKTSPSKILQAIYWCADNGIKLINLSINSNDISLYYNFEAACRYAISRGCIIVAAASNTHEICYPAYVKGIIGVGVAFTTSDEILLKDAPIRFYVSGLHEQKFFTSFATARMTGIIAKMLEQDRKLFMEEVIKRLEDCGIPYDGKIGIMENQSFPYSTEGLLNKVADNKLDNCHTYSFLGGIREAKLLQKYENTCQIKLSNIQYVKSPDLPVSTNPLSNMSLPDDFQFSSDLVVCSIPQSIISQVTSKTNGYQLFSIGSLSIPGVKPLLPPISEFDDELNRKISENKLLFDQSAEKIALINLCYQDNADMEILLQTQIREKGIRGIMYSQDAIVSLFGIRRLQNFQSSEMAGNYLVALVDYFSRRQYKKFILSLNLVSTMVNKYQYDVQDREALVRFASQQIAFNPDSIYIVVDQFTDACHLEFVHRYLKTLVTGCRPLVVIKDASAIADPFYYNPMMKVYANGSTAAGLAYLSDRIEQSGYETLLYTSEKEQKAFIEKILKD